MAIHSEVLQKALEIAGERPDWTFTAREVVNALPQLNESSVRTHIVSRCCVNAPKNHEHKWDYFRRVAHGRYQVTRKYRKAPSNAKTSQPVSLLAGSGGERDTIHVVVRPSDGILTAECMELPIVTQGQSLDEIAANIAEAVSLHLEDEDLEKLGFSADPRIQILYRIPLAS